MRLNRGRPRSASDFAQLLRTVLSVGWFRIPESVSARPETPTVGFIVSIPVAV